MARRCCDALRACLRVVQAVSKFAAAERIDDRDWNFCLIKEFMSETMELACWLQNLQLNRVKSALTDLVPNCARP